MTLTIDLPSRDHPLALLEVGGIGVHVVEGVIARHCSKCDANYRALRTKEHDGPCDRVPDRKWVALSEQMCETCSGRGTQRCDLDDRHIGPCRIGSACPDCLGSGCPHIRITTPCPICLGYYVLHDCRFCDDGSVTIGSVTVEAGPLPIRSAVDGEAARQTFLSMGGKLWTWNDALLTWHIGQQIIDLGPNPEQYVGKFGVIVRRAS